VGTPGLRACSARPGLWISAWARLSSTAPFWRGWELISARHTVARSRSREAALPEPASVSGATYPAVGDAAHRCSGALVLGRFAAPYAPVCARVELTALEFASARSERVFFRLPGPDLVSSEQTASGSRFRGPATNDEVPEQHSTAPAPKRHACSPACLVVLAEHLAAHEDALQPISADEAPSV
jgi:hypothetical protein